MANGRSIAFKGNWKAFEPLRLPTFRSIWAASLLSNFGRLVLGVAVAWEMTRLAQSPQMVALVQTALTLPLTLIAIPAGAIADSLDKRKTAITGLAFSALAAAILAALSALGLTSPWMLLGFCVLIGIGVALYNPSWQASIREQVPPEDLPAAVALGSVSYNIARSFGPALGGVIVLALGATLAFAATACLYVPQLLTFLLWKRERERTALPPERLGRAFISGLRYTIHAPAVRRVMIRAFAFGLATSSIMALIPLVARDLLHGDAVTYGLLLGASGAGAVVGALMVSEARSRFGSESVVRVIAVVMSLMVLSVGISRHIILTGAALFVAGSVNMVIISLLNVSVQLSVPRWVTARALTMYQSSLTGGIALGAWVWGGLAAHWGIPAAFAISSAAIIAANLIGLRAPLPQTRTEDVQVVELRNEPEVALSFTPRSGPVIIEIDYQIDPATAADFAQAMQKVQDSRLRNGAYNWSLARDIADERLWTERYQFPTWEDYVRHRTRLTQSDLALHSSAEQFNKTGSQDRRRVRRRLERPVD